MCIRDSLETLTALTALAALSDSFFLAAFLAPLLLLFDMQTSCRNVPVSSRAPSRTRRHGLGPHTSVMDLLIAPPEIQRHHPVGRRLDLRGLAAAYARPTGAQRWVSVNMVSTIDGAATGADGVTGSINSPADKIVFDLLRALSDIVVIGACLLYTSRCV